MSVASAVPPHPHNETVLSYAPGSQERASLKAELNQMASEVADIPMLIDGAPVRTGKTIEARAPHRKDLLLARAHVGTREHALAAIESCLKVRHEWRSLSQNARSAVFLRAAEILATRSRARINAATMLGQSKTAYQAEIDSACELVDFLRFNVHFASKLLETPISPPGIWNSVEARPLEGFVCAITPFNFTAIAANLPTAPALLGNTVVWKPSPLSLRSNFEILEVLREAGLPPGVINVVQGPAEEIVNACLDHPALAGVHFTGSTPVFRAIWSRVGANISRYKNYPRLVGETGGKDFIFAHSSSDIEALAVAIVRGAFEYQGQKCSAASRAFIPKSIWGELKDRVVAHMQSMKMGDVSDFSNMVGAVIDERAFERLTGVVTEAKADSSYQIIQGGGANSEVGYFVEPTLIQSTRPDSRLMRDEFFGPILTVHVYEDTEESSALKACDEAGPYALTGAIFGRDRAFIERASSALIDSAGNFYVNDKPTGAVVGQQPFGGARASGTNDKAGSSLNLLRWVSARTVKETLDPPRTLGYPSMREA